MTPKNKIGSYEMKKLLLLLLICMAVLIACTNEAANNDTKDKTFSFLATVLEANENYLIVEPNTESIERKSADKIQVSLQDKSPYPVPQVGDTINIVYNGEIMESYPARIGKVYRIEIINSPATN